MRPAALLMGLTFAACTGWPRINPNDPGRCDPACESGSTCIDGECRAQDAGLDGGLDQAPPPDMPTPDLAKPDVLVPDMLPPDMPILDKATPDMPPPDQAAPDMPIPDMPLPDKATPDMPKPDMPKPDLPVPDTLQPDKTPNPDTSNCGGITYTGCCAGNIMKYCSSSGVLTQEDCSKKAQACGWHATSPLYVCGGSGADPSGKYPYACPGADAGPPDMSPPDQAAPDLPVPDGPVPDLPVPDQAASPDINKVCGAATLAGCCMNNGANTGWCDNTGTLKNWPCGSSKCGWSGLFYECGGIGADPTGKHPYACPGSDAGTPDATIPEAGLAACPASYPTMGCCGPIYLIKCVNATTYATPCKSLGLGGCGWNGMHYTCGHTGKDPSGKVPILCPGSDAGPPDTGQGASDQ